MTGREKKTWLTLSVGNSVETNGCIDRETRRMKYGLENVQMARFQRFFLYINSLSPS